MRPRQRLLTWLIASQLAACVACPPSAWCEDRGTADCAVTSVAPYSCDEEASKVVALVEKITRALAHRDFNAMAQYMDERCTTYDESTRKLVVGRDAVIADVKRKLKEEEQRVHEPITQFTIDRPFARIKGDEAVVCFVLIKELGGQHPKRYESGCTDIFVKKDGEWKKLHYRGDDWKLIKDDRGGS